MNERIKQLRKHLDLTQEEFGKRIGVKRNTIATYEMGRNEPIDSVVTLLCREYGVNEEWLRTGAGEMFRPEATDAFDAFVQERGISSNERILIEKFLNLKPESRQVVIDYLLDVAAAISGAASSTGNLGVTYVPETFADEYSVAANIDIDAEVAKYRAELERQKKAVEDLSASRGSKHAG